jgi:diguanylate cyclase (GGDEF)-like protein
MNRSTKDFGKVKAGVAALSGAFIICTAMIDLITRHQTAVPLFYALAIVAAVWFSWRTAAVAAALLSGVCMSVVASIFATSHTAAGAANIWAQSLFFLVFAGILLALRYLQDQLHAMSTMDPLTELVNSSHFLNIGNSETDRALRYKHPFSIIYIDIDDFKHINDAMGHGAGNELLKEIAKKIKGMIRRSDTIARIGGDEFALLMPETGESSVRAAMARIQAKVSDIKASGVKSVTFSIGVITNTGQSASFDEIVNMARSLMHEVKRGGKNAVRYSIFCKR